MNGSEFIIKQALIKKHGIDNLRYLKAYISLKKHNNNFSRYKLRHAKLQSLFANIELLLLL
ncbi:hypothetical protein DSM106972_067610 [Dulcicalothrix desertica PCC 7102]|uniref:Uncharacterized protein n=1 Tax=Dulcicalothrix desertica PCC 7102 TaxID=232991 RepID=A0A433V539_9CYAN|nr:hypothetical protein DSM106972_067610 [Dulcicalothrix desertica PCC 7102]TWH40640.1 hypothetical protein CAL7102_09984 [Dulcicalothrix desertica PCC 7102]